MTKRLALVLVALALFGLIQLTERTWLQSLYLLPSLCAIGFLFLLFARTLLPHREPLVAAIARSVHGHLSIELAHYTRRVTQLWTVIFALMLTEIMLLAYFAPSQTNLVLISLMNLCFVITVFIAEFFCRRLCLPKVEHISFKAYLRLLIQLDLHKIGTS